MSLSRLFRVSIVAFVCAFSVNTASAQSPDAAFGVGVTMTPSLFVFDTSGVATSSTGLYGATVSFAVSPAIHIGTAIGVGSHSVISNSTVSTTQYMFAPYARLLFMGNETFKPMVQAQFLIGSLQTDQTFSKMTFAVGAEHFVNKNFGIYGNVRLVDFDITVPKRDGADGIKTQTFGFLAPTLGIEWFF